MITASRGFAWMIYLNVYSEEVTFGLMNVLEQISDSIYGLNGDLWGKIRGLGMKNHRKKIPC